MSRGAKIASEETSGKARVVMPRRRLATFPKNTPWHTIPRTTDFLGTLTRKRKRHDGYKSGLLGGNNGLGGTNKSRYI